MMDSPEATRLRRLLDDQGASGPTVSGVEAWKAFKEYGREVFGRPGVGLLFQVGVFNFSGKPLFHFDPVCQFEHTDAEGEHDHFEQLHCELTCPPNDALRSVKTNLWSFDYSTAEAFFNAVEALPEFRVAVRQTDYAIAVSHEHV